MNNKFNIEELIVEQKEILSKMENKQRELNSTDIFNENNNLKNKNAKLQLTLEEFTKELNILKEENKQMKDALFSYSFSEKQYLIDKADKNLSTYFNDINDKNQLLDIERKFKTKLQVLRENINNENKELFNKYNNEINNLENDISNNINELINNRTDSITELAREADTEFNKLREKPLTEEEIKNANRKRNLENLIGLNLINKIGILLIVIGVFTASRFAYLRLPEVFKSILIFAIGFLMLGGAEIVNRKKPSIVSLGIAAGGVAVLYLGLSISFFVLKILPMVFALLLTIGITLLAFVLSIRYDSRTIASFALIGGYLPFLSILESSQLLIFSLIYFLALHLLVLTISFKKDWKITSYLGLVLNIVSISTISSNIIFLYVNHNSSNLINLLVIIYSFIAFGIYTVVPIITNKKYEQSFKLPDFIFFILNTFFSSVIIFKLFDIARYNDYYGGLAVVFAFIYYIGSIYMKKIFDKEQILISLFRMISLIFILFFIPLQLDVEWVSMGYLALALVLFVYGLLNNRREFYTGGKVLGIFSIISFIFLDIFLGNLFGIDEYFTLKYTSITLSGIFVLSMMIYKNNILNKLENIFKYISIVNFWFYSMYIIFNEIYPRLYISYINVEYLVIALMISITILIGFILPRIKIIRDNIIYGISMFLYTLSIIFAFLLNSTTYIFSYSSTGAVNAFGTFVILVLTGICVFAVYDLIKLLVIFGKVKLMIIPIVVSAYFLIILTQNLILHYQLGFSSIIISVIYIIMAALWIYFGFVKRITLMRHFGLGLSMVTVIKLFLIDLATLTQGYRIISYFTLGIILVLISYLYQKFEKNIGLQDEIKIIEEE